MQRVASFAAVLPALESLDLRSLRPEERDEVFARLDELLPERQEPLQHCWLDTDYWPELEPVE